MTAPAKPATSTMHDPAPAGDADFAPVVSALDRAVCILATRQPGAPGTVRQILTGQLGLSGDYADLIITAAEQPR